MLLIYVCIVSLGAAEGMTPGVVYGSGKNEQGLGDRHFVKLDTKWANREIRRIQSSFENTVSHSPDEACFRTLPLTVGDTFLCYRSRLLKVVCVGIVRAQTTVLHYLLSCSLWGRGS